MYDQYELYFITFLELLYLRVCRTSTTIVNESKLQENLPIEKFPKFEGAKVRNPKRAAAGRKT